MTYAYTAPVQTRCSPATRHNTGGTAVAERLADQRHRIVQPALQRNVCRTADADHGEATGVCRCEVRHTVHHDVLGQKRRTHAAPRGGATGTHGLHNVCESAFVGHGDLSDLTDFTGAVEGEREAMEV